MLIDEIKSQRELYDKRELLFTDMLLPFDYYKDGIFITRDDKLVKILYVMPTQFILQSPKEQAMILDAFTVWANRNVNKVQFKVIRKEPDIDELLESMLAYADINEHVRPFVEDEAQLVVDTAKKYCVKKHFLMIFEYKPRGEYVNAILEEQIEDFNNQMAMTCSDITTFGVRVIDITNERLFDFLYREFNPRTSKKVSFADRVARVHEDTKKIFGEDKIPPKIPLQMLIAPTEVNTRKSSEYVIVDGMYQMRIGIKTDGYPLGISIFNIFKTILNQIEDIDVDIFVEKVKKDTFLQHTNMSDKMNKLINPTNADGAEKKKGYEELNTVRASNEYMVKAIQQDDEIYYIGIILTIKAYTIENLYDQKVEVIKSFSDKAWKFTNFKMEQEKAFISTMPFCNCDKSLWQDIKQNITGSTLAQFFPYISAEYMEYGGILIGINRIDRSLAYINNFDTTLHNNANIAVYGQSGMGKTYTTSLFCARVAAQGIPVYIISPDKSDEFARITQEINGIYIDPTIRGGASVNLFDIYPQEAPDVALVGSDFQMKSLRDEKIMEIQTFFDLYLSREKDVMTQGELSSIGILLVELYKRFGITEDNDSLYIDPNNKKKGLKKMPIFQDFYDLVCEVSTENNLDIHLPRDFKNIIAVFVNGTYNFLNCETNIDRDNPFIVFALENLKQNPDIQAAVTHMMLQFAYAKVKEDKTKKKLLFADELSVLLNNPKTAVQVKTLAKMIRAYGGSFMFATQSPADAKSKDVGDALMSEFPIALIHGTDVGKEAWQSVIEKFNFTEEEISQYNKFVQGFIFISTNGKRFPVKVVASPKQHLMITTDRSDMEKIVSASKNS